MPAIGDLLAGRYRIDARLGAGGMATVWRARDLRLDRDVAVKVLLPNLAADPAMAARFDREARTLAAVSDPRVVAIFDVVDGDPATGREPFLVMELCPDGSLGSRLDAVGTLPEHDLVPLLADAAEGLAALHRRGIVHRDITPRNVLLSGGRAKIGDVGIARGERHGTGGSEFAEHTPATPPGVAMGTMAYLAPEVLGGMPAGPPADVFGLGGVAYRALAGVPPRDVGPARIARRAPLDIRELDPNVSPDVAEVIMRALSRDPADRPTAEQVATRLRELAVAPAPAAMPVPAPQRAERTELGPTLHDRPSVSSEGAEHPRTPGSWASGATPPGTDPSRTDPRRSEPERPRTPPPGPGYRGPGLWSGELVLALLIALIVFAVVVMLFGR